MTLYKFKYVVRVNLLYFLANDMQMIKMFLKLTYNKF